MAVYPFCVLKIDGTDLFVHSGEHSIPHKFRIQGRALHFRNNCKNAVHIAQVSVLRRDHGIYVHLRHSIEHFQEFLFGILLLFADLMSITSYEPFSPQVWILLRQDRIQASVIHIVVIYILCRNRKPFSVSELHFETILPQDLFHFGDRMSGGLHTVDHGTRNKRVPVVQCLIDIQTSCEHSRRKHGCGRSLFYLAFSLDHIPILLKNPENGSFSGLDKQYSAEIISC